MFIVFYRKYCFVNDPFRIINELVWQSHDAGFPTSCGYRASSARISEILNLKNWKFGNINPKRAFFGRCPAPAWAANWQIEEKTKNNNSNSRDEENFLLIFDLFWTTNLHLIISFVLKTRSRMKNSNQKNKLHRFPNILFLKYSLSITIFTREPLP